MKIFSEQLKLLRLPFSILLMPVILLALLSWLKTEAIKLEHLWGGLSVALILLVLVFPSSQALNSYFDQDEGPINGLPTPPKASSSLLALSLVMQALSVALVCLISWEGGVLTLAYHTASNLYSWPRVRIKKRPFLSAALVSIFQGPVVYAIVLTGLQLKMSYVAQTSVHMWLALATSFLILGPYPVSQVFQFEEDKKRGDHTLAQVLGVQGTFLFLLTTQAIGGAILLYGLLKILSPLEIVGLGALCAPLLTLFLSPVLKLMRSQSQELYQPVQSMLWGLALTINCGLLGLVVISFL